MNRKIKHTKLFFWVLAGLLVLPSVALNAKSKSKFNYDSILKKWTRADEAYNWTNLEARLVWKATYLSDTMLDALITKTSELYDVDAQEATKYLQEERKDQDKYDTFVISIYAGSREHPEVGKDRKLWRMVLEAPGDHPVEPAIWEPFPKTQLSYILFPFQDRWSNTYIVKFPKVTHMNPSELELKMVGIPADSTLKWDLAKLEK